MLHENEYFDIYLDGNDVMLHLKRGGYPLKSFDQITRQHPRIKITSFPVLRKALTDVGETTKIGIYLPSIELDISGDKMKAELTLNVSVEEYEKDKHLLIDQAKALLDEYGVIYGRKTLSADTIIPGSTIIAAEGTPPVQGPDAIVKYINKPDRKPVIREDGSADYYEMNFVTHIKKGDWLGEKIPPKEGTPGSDVFGNELKAQRGNDQKLQYDRKSVLKSDEGERIVLRASFGGALEFLPGDIVSVGRQLIISGDVGPETGSISFDGAVTVNGTVMAGYSVNATGDVSIEGKEGVTNPKEICSSEGDLYIKGGVFGGGVSIIEAHGEIYIKHANNCKLYADTVNVGFYILGSEVIAENIFVDKNKGKIIGGKVEALYRIECGYAGNQHERTTHLHAKGINKDQIYHEIQQMALELKELQQSVAHLDDQLSKIEGMADKLKGPQADAYEKLIQTVEQSRDKMFDLDREIQTGMYKIKTAIPPTIEVSQVAHPGVIIQIGQKSSVLTKQTKGVFEVVDDVLNV